MNGCDHGAIERALVMQPALPFITVGSLQNMIESFTKAFAHLVRGAVGEGDGDDLIEVQFLLAQDVQVALNQDGRLAGAGAGSDGDVAVNGVGGSRLLGL